MDAQEAFETLFVVENIDHLEPETALEHLARLIDLSVDLRRLDGTEKAIQLAEALQGRSLSSPQSSLLHYFLSNAWANVGLLSRTDPDAEWAWEQPEFEKQIIHLRRAVREGGFGQLPSVRQTQVFTNLGNLLSQVGRFIEAQECWSAALTLQPQFTMALGNRGRGRLWYAKALYDDGHRTVFLRHAFADLDAALSAPRDDSLGPDSGARKGFQKHRDGIRRHLPKAELRKGTRMKEFSLGETEQEVRYRKWCLANCLFLNPLNDLGNHSVAAHDVLTTPSMVVEVGEGPHYQGFFNQMKQEFVSARWFYHEGITARKPHFSDKDVTLYNTLDYPCYSLAVEKVKVAFRIAYSLLDKIAFFFNHYLGLGIPEKRVYFKTFWYSGQNRKQGLRHEFTSRPNWPLRGLFWLSKDLFEDKPGFRESLEPDAQELDAIRNHAEHKYLKLHDGMWRGPDGSDDPLFSHSTDTLAASFYRRDFESKALRLLKMARAALIYLSLAIHSEEAKRERERPKKGVVLPMFMDTWDDQWKV
jgi:tetratricopeptide (TPR) repeat protein